MGVGQTSEVVTPKLRKWNGSSCAIGMVRAAQVESPSHASGIPQGMAGESPKHEEKKDETPTKP